MSATDFNRKPVRYIEVTQPRCALRFGEAPCTATGTPLCYNTFWTCLDRENYDPTDVIKWRFFDGRNGTPWLYGSVFELITNGDFNTDLVGWTTFSGTQWAWDSGLARLTSDGSLSKSILSQSATRAGAQPYSFSQVVISGAGLTLVATDSQQVNPQITLSNEEGTGTATGTLPDGYDTITFANFSGSATEVTLDNVSITSSTNSGIGTNAFPVLQSASTLPSRINVGGQSEDETPFGRRAKLTVTLAEFPFDDHVGDFYVDDPSRNNTNAGFWAKFLARNPFYPNMTVTDYQGYEGQALSEMVKREYVLDNIEQNGPKSVTLTARDPLDLASDKKAQFPRASDIQLFRNINSSQTSNIRVFCVETELSDDFGNTGSTRYVRIGAEIIRYTGWTGTAPEFTLTGVVRGTLGTTAASHSEGDSGQRAGRYENIRLYRVAQDLLQNHTTIPSRFYNFTQWEDEGDVWLPSLQTDATIAEPVSVEKLMAELSRDGLFYVWWDERGQTIPMKAIKPPQQTPVVWSDTNHIIEDSFGERAESDDFITRVVIRYNRKDPTEALDNEENYRVQSIYIDAESESEDATGGAVRSKDIFSRWINTGSNALLVSASLVLQYKFIPRYLTVEVDAKDRAVGIGSIIDLDTRHKVDSEGTRVLSRYQIIELEETQPSEKARVEMQSFQFVGKFAIIMANDAPDYVDATDEEKINGCWFSENDGLMPDGSDGYLLQ